MTMSRKLIAFLVAPLVVPVLMFPYLDGLTTTSFWLGFALAISVIITYVGTVVLGVPGYMLLRGRNWTSLWIAPLLGFAIGAFMWLVFHTAFVLLLDQGMSGVRSALANPSTWEGALWPGGIAGAVVGATLWLIARPDR
jgi:hypothetical protein